MATLFALDLERIHMFLLKEKSKTEFQTIPTHEISWGEPKADLAMGTWIDVNHAKIYCWIKNVGNTGISYNYKMSSYPTTSMLGLFNLQLANEWKSIQGNPKGRQRYFARIGDIRPLQQDIVSIKPHECLDIKSRTHSSIKVERHSNQNATFTIDFTEYLWPLEIFREPVILLSLEANIGILNDEQIWSIEKIKSSPIIIESKTLKKLTSKTMSYIYSHDRLRIVLMIILIALPLMAGFLFREYFPFQKCVLFGIASVFIFSGIMNSLQIQPIFTGRDYSFPPAQSSSNIFSQAKDWVSTCYPACMEVFYWPIQKKEQRITFRTSNIGYGYSKAQRITFMHFFYPLSILIGLGLLTGIKERFFIWTAFIYALLFLPWIPFESQGYFYYANFCSAGYWFSYGPLFLTLRIALQLLIIFLIYWFVIRGRTINKKPEATSTA